MKTYFSNIQTSMPMLICIIMSCSPLVLVCISCNIDQSTARMCTLLRFIRFCKHLIIIIFDIDLYSLSLF